MAHSRARRTWAASTRLSRRTLKRCCSRRRTRRARIRRRRRCIWAWAPRTQWPRATTTCRASRLTRRSARRPSRGRRAATRLSVRPKAPKHNAIQSIAQFSPSSHPHPIHSESLSLSLSLSRSRFCNFLVPFPVPLITRRRTRSHHSVGVPSAGGLRNL